MLKYFCEYNKNIFYILKIVFLIIAFLFLFIASYFLLEQKSNYQIFNENDRYRKISPLKNVLNINAQLLLFPEQYYKSRGLYDSAYFLKENSDSYKINTFTNLKQQQEKLYAYPLKLPYSIDLIDDSFYKNDVLYHNYFIMNYNSKELLYSSTKPKADLKILLSKKDALNGMIPQEFNRIASNVDFYMKANFKNIIYYFKKLTNIDEGSVGNLYFYDLSTKKTYELANNVIFETCVQSPHGNSLAFLTYNFDSNKNSSFTLNTLNIKDALSLKRKNLDNFYLPLALNEGAERILLLSLDDKLKIYMDEKFYDTNLSINKNSSSDIFVNDLYFSENLTYIFNKTADKLECLKLNFDVSETSEITLTNLWFKFKNFIFSLQNNKTAMEKIELNFHDIKYDEFNFNFTAANISKLNSYSIADKKIKTYYLNKIDTYVTSFAADKVYLWDLEHFKNKELKLSKLSINKNNNLYLDKQIIFSEDNYIYNLSYDNLSKKESLSSVSAQLLDKADIFFVDESSSFLFILNFVKENAIENKGEIKIQILDIQNNFKNIFTFNFELNKTLYDKIKTKPSGLNFQFMYAYNKIKALALSYDDELLIFTDTDYKLNHKFYELGSYAYFNNIYNFTFVNSDNIIFTLNETADSTHNTYIFNLLTKNKYISAEDILSQVKWQGREILDFSGTSN